MRLHVETRKTLSTNKVDDRNKHNLLNITARYELWPTSYTRKTTTRQGRAQNRQNSFPERSSEVLTIMYETYQIEMAKTACARAARANGFSASIGLVQKAGQHMA
eukprot:3779309-Amphidinium_carterae.1